MDEHNDKRPLRDQAVRDCTSDLAVKADTRPAPDAAPVEIGARENRGWTAMTGLTLVF